ncbi:MAG: hypothetical protein CMN28_07725 [Salinisphaeraceae bacterium]|jgi:hypothetical protein|nr:hypothetical protein [Salinisphaeraceae bacterium]
MSSASRRAIVTLALGLALGGCVSSKVEQLRESPVTAAAPGSGHGVVVLGRKQNVGNQAEAGVVACVADRLEGGPVTVLSEADFRNGMFPWFEPRTAPQDPAGLARLLADSAVEARVAELGVRYLVWLDGYTSDKDRGGGMSCAAGPGGGGCLGFVWWENQAEYEASVWDLEKRTAVGRVSVDATGTSYMPAVLIPIPMVARTRSAACGGVADQLRELLIAPE